MPVLKREDSAAPGLNEEIPDLYGAEAFYLTLGLKDMEVVVKYGLAETSVLTWAL